MLKLRRSLAWILIVVRLLFLAGCSVAPSAVSPPALIEPTASPSADPTQINVAPTPWSRPELGSRTIPPTPTNGIVMGDQEMIDGLALHLGDTLALSAAAGDSNGLDISSQITWYDHTGTALGTGATLTYVANTVTMETVTAAVGTFAVRVSFTVSPLDVTVAEHVKVLPEDVSVSEQSSGVWEVIAGTTPLPTLYANDVVVGSQLVPVQISAVSHTSPAVITLSGAAALPNQVIHSGTASFSQEVDWSGDSGEVIVIDQPPVPFHLADLLTPKWSGFVQAGNGITQQLLVTAQGTVHWQPTFSGMVEFDQTVGDGLKSATVYYEGGLSTVLHVQGVGHGQWWDGGNPLVVLPERTETVVVRVGVVPIPITLRAGGRVVLTPAATIGTQAEVTVNLSEMELDETLSLSPQADWTAAVDWLSGTEQVTIADGTELSGPVLMDYQQSLSVSIMNQASPKSTWHIQAMALGHETVELSAIDSPHQGQVNGQQNVGVAVTLFYESPDNTGSESRAVFVASLASLVSTGVALLGAATLAYAVLPEEQKQAFASLFYQTTSSALQTLSQSGEMIQLQVEGVITALKQLLEALGQRQQVLDHLERCYLLDCPTPTPTPTPSPSPSPLTTPVPLCTLIPTPTPSPTPSCDPVQFLAWANQFAGSAPVVPDEDWYLYESRVCGSTQYNVQGGGESVKADAIDVSTCSLIDCKYSSPTLNSLLVKCSPFFIIDQSHGSQFRRYGAVISDPTTPARNLQIKTNTELALPCIDMLLSTNNVPSYQTMVSP